MEKELPLKLAVVEVAKRSYKILAHSYSPRQANRRLQAPEKMYRR